MFVAPTRPLICGFVPVRPRTHEQIRYSLFEPFLDLYEVILPGFAQVNLRGFAQVNDSLFTHVYYVLEGARWKLHENMSACSCLHVLAFSTQPIGTIKIPNA